MPSRERVFLGFGSNQGDRRAMMTRALEAVAESGKISILAVSSLYLTEPVGYNKQRYFCNGVAEVGTTLSPHDLLQRLKDIEKALGRDGAEMRWGPRLIDLDLLLYGSRVMKTGTLVLPHPRMHERRFVLLPLAEIDPEVKHPLLGKTIAGILASLDDNKEVKLLGKWKTE